jgi:outer membrane protein assembly factor BamB
MRIIRIGVLLWLAGLSGPSGLSGLSGLSSDWPEFRGPTGQGISTERGLPVEWSESKNILWKVPVPGSGWSSPVVMDGKIWLTSAVGNKDVSLRVLSFDLETGRALVDAEVFRLNRGADINPKNSRASPTPILDGDRVYVHFGADGTAALTTAGAVVWKTKFPYESQHGNGGSPIVYRDLLILSCDGGDNAFVIALDKSTGKVKWKTWRRQPYDQAYTTPLIIRVGDRDEVVSIGAYRATAYDPMTGAEIWRVGYADGFSNVPRPVYGHGLVYIATGFQQPTLLAVRADGSGDVTKTHIAWRLTRGAPLTPSPLLVGDELYVVSDGGIVTCVDAMTGAVHWQQRLATSASASPVLADGRIYVLGEDGRTAVFAPGPTFQPIGVNQLDGATLASMAVASGSFIIRSDRNLYRIVSK